jgi:hypothetical protein
MLIDALNTSNYLSFNITAANILGLKNAVYCSVVFNIYQKAERKNKLLDNKFMKVSRDYVKHMTSLSFEEQYECDKSLSRVGIITLNDSDPDLIKADFATFASIITDGDIKVLADIAKKAKPQKTDSAEAKKKKAETKIKSAICRDNIKIANALDRWVDAISMSDKVYVSEDTVKDFQRVLMKFAGTDVEKALAVIEIATAQTWTSCTWAISAYEKEHSLKGGRKEPKVKVASADEISGMKF